MNEEINNHPTSTVWDRTIKDEDYPRTVRLAIEEYTERHAIWTWEYTALAAKINEVGQAEIDDRAALSAAILAGKSDPGAEIEKARRAVVVQAERCKQAREMATASTDTLKATFAASAPELVPIVLANIRRALTDYQSTVASMEPLMKRLGKELQDAYSGGARMIDNHLRNHYHCVAFGGEFGAVEPIRFPRSAFEQIEHRLHTAEKAVEAIDRTPE